VHLTQVVSSESILSVSKGAYTRLLRNLEESLAANQQLQKQVREQQSRISELETFASRATEFASVPLSVQVSIIEKILLFFEHGLFLAAVGIAGPLMVPLSNWFLLLPAACLALAFHRVGVVRGRPRFQQIPSYLLIALIGLATGFGIHVAIEKQENELISRIAALLPKPKPIAVPVAPTSAQPPPTKGSSSIPTIRPYDLPDKRRNELLALLAAPPVGANKLRIGCVPWSDRACAGAGKFLIILSQAGWKIDENKVFRVDNAIPVEGVSITERPDPGAPTAPQPPHLGRYQKMGLTDITFMTALTSMGLKYNGSSEASLPDGTTGVYFGPEPSSLIEVNKQYVLRWEAIKYANEIAAVDQQPSSIAAKSFQKAQLSGEIENWLRTNAGKEAASHFRRIPGAKDQEEYLDNLGMRLHKLTQQ
jgi:hypothetical protein